MINNEVDLLCEVTLEEFQTMKESNDKINCWYNDFPYANPDDRVQKESYSPWVKAHLMTMQISVGVLL